LIYDTIPDRAPYSQQRIYYLDYPASWVLYAVRNNSQITEPMLDQRYPNNWKVGWTQSHGSCPDKREESETDAFSGCAVKYATP